MVYVRVYNIIIVKSINKAIRPITSSSYKIAHICISLRNGWLLSSLFPLLLNYIASVSTFK